MMHLEQTSDQLLASLSQRIDKPSASLTESANTPREYAQAAAVLHVFDPLTLKPFGASPGKVGEALSALFKDSEPAIGFRAEQLRTLRLDARRSALAELGTRERMRSALDANRNRRNTELQDLFERWLTGESFALETLSYAQLTQLQRLYEWGLMQWGELPDAAAVEKARLRRAAVAVFEHLVDENFVGRVDELQKLRDHVGVVSPSRWAALRAFLPGQTSALVVSGTGGSGKTALIGRFLLEHVTSPAAGWFPFAYLPFDSETLDVGEPFTLLVAAVAQLSAQTGDHEAQIPEVTRAIETFRSVVAEYRDERGVLQQRAAALASQRVRYSRLSSAEQRLSEAFGALLNAISSVAGKQQGATSVPVLIVFDSFEEVLYRTREVLGGLWGMLTIVQEVFPGLRIVIASRAKPRDFEIAGKGPAFIELDSLSENDSVSLLNRLGVRDASAARAIAKQVGGHPLSLRLAARVAAEEPSATDGISGLKTKRYWLLGIADELIQGQLYRRILNHIHDPDVRTLAHPGMVLRRITADLIEKVVAPVCGLHDVTTERANELLEILASEHTLVSVEEDGALKYREDVRHPMLLLLVRDKPEDVRRIHQAVVDYYATREPPTPLERAEEIYHRLMLQQSKGEVMGRWLEGVERFLGDVIPDIPAEQSVWLAERMSIELPKDVYKKAELADWERLIGKKALDAIRHAGPNGALELLSERKDRTPESPLYAIEARCLIASQRLDAAYVLLDHAIDEYPAFGNAGRLGELLWMKADLELSRDAKESAAELLVQLADMSKSFASPITRVQALTALAEVEASMLVPPLTSTREALGKALDELDPAVVDAERSVVGVALIQLGKGFPNTVGKLLPYVVAAWETLLEIQRFDIRPVLDVVTRGLRDAGRDDLAAMSTTTDVENPAAALGRAYALMDRIIGQQMDTVLAGAVLQLLDAGHPTLRGASLAGLDIYREPWELETARELRA
jgi:tetratricopeptide (TPR) repeat protein